MGRGLRDQAYKKMPPLCTCRFDLLFFTTSKTRGPYFGSFFRIQMDREHPINLIHVFVIVKACIWGSVKFGYWKWTLFYTLNFFYKWFFAFVNSMAIGRGVMEGVPLVFGCFWGAMSASWDWEAFPCLIHCLCRHIALGPQHPIRFKSNIFGRFPHLHNLLLYIHFHPELIS